MKIEITIPDAIIRDAIGGSNIPFWANTLTWEREDLILEIEEHEDAKEGACTACNGQGVITDPSAPDEGDTLDCIACDGEGVTSEGPRVRLTREDFERGARILAEKLPHHFKDLIAETGDAWTGNYLVQCAAFGEVKYE